MLPAQRQDSLLIQEIGDELVVYDLERDRVHRLNPTTALIWRHCDGQTTVAELAALLETAVSLPASERIVALALDQLARARLLRERPAGSREAARISRREAIAAGLAGAAALLLPGCDSITAPAPHVGLSPAQQPIPPCEGRCSFKQTITYTFKKVGDAKQVTGFEWRKSPDEGSHNCNPDTLTGKGKFDFKERGKEACLIRSGEDFVNSPTKCGTTVDGIESLKKDADFEWIDIDFTHELACEPHRRCEFKREGRFIIGDCEGEPTKGMIRVMFKFENGKVTHNGKEAAAGEGKAAVTYTKEVPCKGQCVT